MRRAFLALAVSAAAAAACGAGPSSPATGPTPPALRRCVGTPFSPAPLEGWTHTLTPITVALGSPNHSMQDVIATPGATATLHGKFTYGAVSKDLEDEDVRLQVMGDGTVAPGRVWILPAGTRVAVTDIDGTLTTSDEELVLNVVTDFFEPILQGTHVPEAYPGAAALTNALVGRGYVLVFLTGRPYWLTGKTRDWLSDGGFALGPLHVTDSNGEAIPSVDGVGAFKLAYLRSLAAAGFVLDEAYGNATTDVYAYAGAAIPPAATWIIGPNGGAGGTNEVAGSWEARAAAVSARPAVPQPFVPPGS